jgi:hypothetical protein
MLQLLRKDNLLNKGNLTPRGAFIVGCGHSGTSILLRILASHSSVWAIPKETGLFINASSEHEIVNRLQEFQAETLRHNKEMWIEKTPKHVLEIDKILKYVPDTKFVGMIRDPRDTACSIKARGLSFKEGLDRWTEDNSELYSHRHLQNIIFIKLEDLIKTPSAVVSVILKHIGLPEEDLLNYHLHPTSWYSDSVIETKPENAIGTNHNKMRNWQMNRPLFASTNRHTKDMNDKDSVIFDNNISQIKVLADFFGYGDLEC